MQARQVDDKYFTAKAESDQVSFVAVISKDSDIDQLRELVGSLQGKVKLYVYASNLSWHILEEIQAWKYAIPMQFYQSVGSDELKIQALQNIVELEGAAVLVDVSIKFHQGPEKLIKDFNKFGFIQVDGILGVVQGSAQYKEVVVDRLNCSRFFNCDIKQRPRKSNALYQGVSTDKDGYYNCFIDFRPDLMYNDFYSVKQINVQLNLIYLGVPVLTSDGEKLEDIALLSTFIPSLVRSISQEERSKFVFVVCVLYDHGDFWFDNEERRKLIESRINGIDVEFKRVPKSHAWLTFIWNYGFVYAMSKGAQYYYQVNDDLRFDSEGWATKFTQSLDHGYGVAGPNDPKWNCSLLTQAMVNRKHYETFGWFFPLEIKDWYSDFWITHLYKPDKLFCSKFIVATNLQNKGGRYKVCNRARWNLYVQRDKKLL